jgi:hypothetical protein
LSDLAVEALHPGDTVEFGVSQISSVRVQDMQQLGYFGSGVGRVPGAEEVPEPEGELVVFEAFFTAGLRLPAHRFVAEVLRRFEVQVHQLTRKCRGGPGEVCLGDDFVWWSALCGGLRKALLSALAKEENGHEIAQFGSCTFTPRTGKTSMEVVELVPCAAISGATGGIFGFTFPKAQSKTTQGSQWPSCARIIT